MTLRLVEGEAAGQMSDEELDEAIALRAELVVALLRRAALDRRIRELERRLLDSPLRSRSC